MGYPQRGTLLNHESAGATDITELRYATERECRWLYWTIVGTHQ